MVYLQLKFYNVVLQVVDFWGPYVDYLASGILSSS